jgi:HK97 family phage portal protein
MVEQNRSFFELMGSLVPQIRQANKNRSEEKYYNFFADDDLVYNNRTFLQGWNSKAGLFDVSEIGDGSSNSAVTACLQTLGTSFAEPKLFIKVQDKAGELETIYSHQFITLLDRPNPFMSGDMLKQYIINAMHVSGDAYLLKQRNGGGQVISLYPLMPAKVTPKGNEEILITHYEYEMTKKTIEIKPEDMIHLRMSVNPENHRKGFSPLSTVLREIYGDESAGQLATALLANMGVPGLIISPNDDYGPNEEEAKEIANTFKRKFGGPNRGEPLVMSGNMKVEPISLSPRDLDIGTLRRVPEERVSAVLGVPAILAGLGAGLDRATYSNARELREYFTENKLIPLWRLVAQELTYQLLIPDFEFNVNAFAEYDLSEVRALQTDANDLYTRMSIAVKNGWATVAEAREIAGLPTDDSQAIYFIPNNVQIVKANELMEHSMEHGNTQEVNPVPEEQQDAEDIDTSDDEEYKTIKKEDNEYCVYSKDGKTLFGCYPNEELAKERLRQIEMFGNG